MDPATWPPAVGQASLAVECRANDRFTLSLLAHVSNDAATWMAIAERSFMARLEGGCSVPIGVHCTEADPGTLKLRGFVYSTGEESICLTAEEVVDSESGVNNSVSNQVEDDKDGFEEDGIIISGIFIRPEKAEVAKLARNLGLSVADDLLAQGAGEVLAAERLKNAATS